MRFQYAQFDVAHYGPGTVGDRLSSQVRDVCISDSASRSAMAIPAGVCDLYLAVWAAGEVESRFSQWDVWARGVAGVLDDHCLG
jgi:hypothetical protein